MTQDSRPKLMKFRRYASSILLELVVSSVAAKGFLFCLYMVQCPMSPDPAYGYIYQTSNKWSYRYMNMAEAMSMRLAFMLFLPSVLALIVVIPKAYVVRKKMGSKKGFDVVDPVEPNHKELAILLITIVTFFGTAFLFGTHIVRWALKSGFSAP